MAVAIGKSCPNPFRSRCRVEVNGTMILCWRAALAIFSALASSTRRPISQSSAFISRSDVAFGDRTAAIMDDVAGALVSATLRHVENLFGLAPDDIGAENVAEGARYYFHVSNG